MTVDTCERLRDTGRVEQFDTAPAAPASSERQVVTYVETKEGHIIQTDSPELWTECKPLPATEGKRLLKAQSAAKLRKLCPPGSTIYTVLRHVSSSGMTRRITCFAIVGTGRKAEPFDLGGYIADVLGYKRHERDGSLVVSGCGMDMGFHIVHSLGYALWPKGTRKPHGTRNGAPDADGGYALKHRWL